MINIIKDVDLFNHFSEYDAVLIGTNTYCTMSQGIQLKVMLEYPYVYEKNLETKYADPEKLGTLLECKSEGEPTFCLCFITNSYNFRPDLNNVYISYESVEKCLKLVNILYRGKKVATTLLGASRFDGNGDKNKVMEIFNKTITDVDLTIYDYEQKSRAEEMKEWYTKEKEMKTIDKKKYYKMVSERKKKADERFKKNGHRRY
jgi:hypothetical protein